MHYLFHFAYLDAGTGSLIIQSLIGIVAGIAVFGRRTIAKIKLKFNSMFHKNDTAATPVQDSKNSKSKNDK